MRVKKWTTWNLIACVWMCVLILGGCKTEQTVQSEKPVQGEQTLQPEESAQEASDSQPVSAAPQIIIESSREEQWNKNCDKVLLTGGLDTITVSGEGYEAAAAAVAAWNQENQTVYTEVMKQYLEWVEADAEIQDEYVPSFAVDYGVESTRVDTQVISLLQNCYENGGGAHGNYWYQSANFDAQSGQKLTLKDLFADADGFCQWAVEECWKRISKEYGECLFADAEETVRAAWEADPVWYLDAAGITILFSPYEIGPYAMGEAAVTFTYEECSQWMKPEYAGFTNVGVAELPWDTEAFLPLGGAAGQQKVKLWIEPNGDGMGEVHLWVGESAYSLDIGERGGSAYVIRKENGRVFVMFDADPASDDYITYIYDITDAAPILLAQEYMSILPGSVSTERVQLITRVDLLGTYSSQQDYAISPEGQLVRLSETYEYMVGYGHGVVTAKQPIPVICQGQEKTLPAGTRLRITGTDRESIAYYELIQTGETGEIHFTFIDENRLFVEINGINEVDCFDDMPYAG